MFLKPVSLAFVLAPYINTWASVLHQTSHTKSIKSTSLLLPASTVTRYGQLPDPFIVNMDRYSIHFHNFRETEMLTEALQEFLNRCLDKIFDYMERQHASLRDRLPNGCVSIRARQNNTILAIREDPIGSGLLFGEVEYVVEAAKEYGSAWSRAGLVPLTTQITVYGRFQEEAPRQVAIGALRHLDSPNDSEGQDDSLDFCQEDMGSIVT